MAGYCGMSMSNNAIEAYNEGKKPFSRITREDIQKYGINESVTFFQWYVNNSCSYCEWHHTSAKFNITLFYDIEKCCNQFKKEDINILRNKYKNRRKPKSDVIIDDTPYYAKVEYSISTFSGSRKYLEEYAIVHRYWAYIKDDYRKEIIRKKINGKHFRISEKYQSRPEGMPEDVANNILGMICK